MTNWDVARDSRTGHIAGMINLNARITFVWSTMICVMEEMIAGMDQMRIRSFARALLVIKFISSNATTLNVFKGE